MKSPAAGRLGHKAAKQSIFDTSRQRQLYLLRIADRELRIPVSEGLRKGNPHSEFRNPQ
jgi:hypothetical protein